MNRQTILQEVTDVLVEQFELRPDQIKLESHLVNDLDLDSIDAIDMAVRLQDMLGKRIAEEQLHALQTVGDIVDLVANKHRTDREVSDHG